MKENKQKFQNIEAENLNIVDKDGNVKMSLFNSENIPSLIMEGKDILPDHRQNDNTAGIMFYSGEGDECGGLIFGSERDDNGKYTSGLSLTFDQYKQDQILQMLVAQQNGERHYGFHIFDRPDSHISETVEKVKAIQEMEEGPEKEKATQELAEGQSRRAFMGKGENGDVSVRLADSQGNDRIRMVIDANDVPHMEFLNEKGEVVYSLPPE